MLNVMFSTFSTKPAPQRLLAVFAHRFGELSDPTVVLSQPFPFFLDSGWLIVFLHCSSLCAFAMYAPFEKRGQGGTRRAEREHKCMVGGRGGGPSWCVWGASPPRPPVPPKGTDSFGQTFLRCQKRRQRVFSLCAIVDGNSWVNSPQVSFRDPPLRGPPNHPLFFLFAISCNLFQERFANNIF